VVRSFAIQGIDAFIASGEHPVPDHRKKGYIRLMERIEEKGRLCKTVQLSELFLFGC